MVDGMLKLIPVRESRPYRTCSAIPRRCSPYEYYINLPTDAHERLLIVIDPMLATGGSAIAAIDALKERGCTQIKLMCLIAAPEGVEAVQEAHPDVDIYLAALDSHLNDHGYIVPGLGDAGRPHVRHQISSRHCRCINLYRSEQFVAKLKVMTIFGTRPEAVKMAPLVLELQKHPDEIESIVCVTAQHRQMLDQVLDFFKILPNYDLNVMKDRQTLTETQFACLKAWSRCFAEAKPDIVLVHGDTQTTFLASYAAFLQQIQVGHVEAGLADMEQNVAVSGGNEPSAGRCSRLMCILPRQNGRQTICARRTNRNRPFM